MANFMPRGATTKSKREVKDTRKPSYKIYILDTSTSMLGTIPVLDGGDEIKTVRKIDELNRGVELSLKSLKEFEEKNVLYKIFYQIIELNSYGKALFSEFVPVASANDKIAFQADGVTCLENSLNTCLTYLDPKYMPGNKRTIDIFLFSDGCPTDVDGYRKIRSEYLKTLELFDHELQVRGLAPYVTKHAIFIGDDESGEETLRSFADEGNFYLVKDTESIADKLVFATIKSQKRQSSRKLTACDKEEGDILDSTVEVRQIDITKCLGESCGLCAKSCPVGAISQSGGIVSIAPDLCVGCGICSEDCPADAVYLMELLGM
ncbi:MAG: hypothetical protein E7675_02135 [Ruminococcaceae bacterium]|nr:hypothetical protein [Oscillospiraceae bacterium]